MLFDLLSSSARAVQYAHTGPVTGVCFAADCSLLFSCSEDGTYRAAEINGNVVYIKKLGIPMKFGFSFFLFKQ